MKKILFVLTILIALSINTFATHNIAGTIGYKHISGLTYEIRITTYTNDLAGAADRCELVIQFGDGTSQTVQRINGVACSSSQSPCNHCGEIISGGTVKMNIYQTTHTYPSANTYIISMLDPNRNQGILNIPNSVQVPFYIESELVILSSTFVNSSPVFTAEPVANAQLGTTFRQNISAYDLDGDILSYELVTSKGTGGQDIPGYYIPDSVFIDLVNGELIWYNTPQIGEYVFTIKISECRNNSQIGFVLVDISVIVTPSPVIAQFTGLLNWPTDYLGRYSMTIGPNDSVELDLTYEDLYANSSIDLNAYSETAFSGDSSSFDYVGSSSTAITRQFKWKPNSANLRCAPYVVTFRGSSTNSTQKTSQDITLMIFVRDQTTINCGTICGAILSNNDLEERQNKEIRIAPNPFNEETTITFDLKNVKYLDFNLYDLLGKKVKTIPVINQNQITLYRNELPAGIYIYELVSESKIEGSGKIIITD